MMKHSLSVVLVAGLALAIAQSQAQQAMTADPNTWPVAFDGTQVGGPYAWVDGATALKNDPNLANAVQGGQEGAVKLYVCRASNSQDGGVHVGKFFNGQCNIGWGGKEIEVKQGFQVLVNSRPELAKFLPQQWVAPSTPSTYVGGMQANAGMRVCRATHTNGSVHPGKEYAGKCNYGYGGKEIVAAAYQVLQLGFDKTAWAATQTPVAGAQPAATGGFRASITKQMTNLDTPTTGTIEIGTLQPMGSLLQYVGVDVPAGLKVLDAKTTNNCPSENPKNCRQLFTWTIAAGQNCTWDGEYKARLNMTCAAGAAGCAPGPREFTFKLKSENFCSERTVTVDVQTVKWESVPGPGPNCARDIGGGAGGHVWAIGCEKAPVEQGGDYRIYNRSDNAWKTFPGSGNRIAVEPAGWAWIVASNGGVVRWGGGGVTVMKGACAQDIAVGGNGDVWTIGCDAAPGGGGNVIRKLSPQSATVPGAGVRIAAEPNGNPWVVNDRGEIFRWTGSAFTRVDGCAKDIAIGKDGIPWVIGCSAVTGGFEVFRWTGNGWGKVPGAGVALSIGGDNQAWIIDSTGKVSRRVN